MTDEFIEFGSVDEYTYGWFMGWMDEDWYESHEGMEGLKLYDDDD